MLFSVLIHITLISGTLSYVCNYCYPPIMGRYFPNETKFDSCATSASWKTKNCLDGCSTGTVRGNGKSMTIRTCASAKAQTGCTTVPANENEATTNCKCVSDKCNSEDEAPEKPFVKMTSSSTSYPCLACVPDADKDVIDGARGGGDCLTVPNGTQFQCITTAGCLDVYTTSPTTKATYVKRQCAFKAPDIPQKNNCTTTTDATTSNKIETCHCTGKLCNVRDLRRSDIALDSGNSSATSFRHHLPAILGRMIVLFSFSTYAQTIV